MFISPLVVALASSVLAVGTFAAYLSTIPRRTVAAVPTRSLAAMALALVMAFGAMAWSASGAESVVVTMVTSGFGWMLPLAFAALFAARKVPQGDLQVKVGAPLLPFGANTHEGAPWQTDGLAGKRVLIKFFRGQWCPYCSAELRLFEELRPQLEARGVHIIALSKDTVADAAHQHKRDKLGFVLLSDPQLAVIRQYGVVHHKALEFSKGGFTVFGMPLALVPQVKTMAIPTTLLVDEHGVVRWIDQSEDYRIRGGEARVLAAVDSVFGTSAPS